MTNHLKKYLSQIFKEIWDRCYKIEPQIILLIIDTFSQHPILVINAFSSLRSRRLDFNHIIEIGV